MSTYGYDALDWDTAIAAATLAIGAHTKKSKHFLRRGIARCFKADTDGKHAGAIEDLSSAIALSADEKVAYYYRACAHYLDGNYERAIADCLRCGEPEKSGLLGKIYTSLGKYQEAAEAYAKALRWYKMYKPLQIPPPSLLCEYIESCNNMNTR